MGIKVDFKKTLKQLYNPSKRGLHIVEVPGMNFLMVDGRGDPNISSEYQQAIEALYNMSYGIKFALKSHGYDHVIPPLEGLWWMEDMNEFNRENIARWEWTMMIMQPDWVLAEAVERVRADVIKKKGILFPETVRHERYHEGLAVQTLYTGAYKDESPVIAEIHAFIKSNGYQTNGKHHEIYLSDARKTPADKLQTILRQPIRQI
jgi:hypothetical protein